VKGFIRKIIQEREEDIDPNDLQALIDLLSDSDQALDETYDD
jgi:hypothetical protein